MTDRGIIFSGPMVCALAQNRKTQTRRIPTRLLWCVKPGDRFYVREALRQCKESGQLLYRADDQPVPAERLPAGFAVRRSTIPGMLMPSWASRLTLIVKRAWAEPLQAITRENALAEGVEFETADPPFYYVPGFHPHSLTGVGVEEGGGRHAERSYEKLWGLLHTKRGQRWQDNPEIIALEFEVIPAHIWTL